MSASSLFSQIQSVLQCRKGDQRSLQVSNTSVYSLVIRFSCASRSLALSLSLSISIHLLIILWHHCLSLLSCAATNHLSHVLKYNSIIVSSKPYSCFCIFARTSINSMDVHAEHEPVLKNDLHISDRKDANPFTEWIANTKEPEV